MATAVAVTAERARLTYDHRQSCNGCDALTRVHVVDVLRLILLLLWYLSMIETDLKGLLRHSKSAMVKTQKDVKRQSDVTEGVAHGCRSASVSAAKHSLSYSLEQNKATNAEPAQ